MEGTAGSNCPTMKKRIHGIDLLKIVACALVVAVHTIDARLGIVNRLLQMSTVVAIPLFFEINGFLVLSKRSMDSRYVFHKIIKILLICFSWEFFNSIANYIVYRKVISFVSGAVFDLIQKGNFFQFWFLGALIILYAATPLLHRMLRNKEKLYSVIMLVCGVACIVIDFLQFLLKWQFISVTIQTFRVWQWGFYYMLGGYIAKYKDRIEENLCKISKITTFFLLALSIVVMFGWMWFCRETAFGYLDIGGFYGAFPTIITAAGMLVIAMRSRIDSRIVRLIAPTTMGVYIIHAHVMSYWVHFFPTFSSNAWLNILWWLLTIGSCMAITKFLSKIPFIKELITMESK